MRIICPTCACHYEVDAENVGPAGQLVRCAECRDVWLVRRTDELARPQRDAASALVSRPDRDNAALAAATATAAGRPAPVSDAAGDPIDFASARARLRRRGSADGSSRLRGSSAGTLLSLAAACAALAGVAIGSRAAVVTRLPKAALAAVGLPAQPAGLALQDVRSVVSTEGDRTVLDLQGRIANLQDRPAAVPDLSVVVRDNSATPLYSWKAAAPTPSLKGGETVAFRTRLQAPPTGGRDVRVSFADISPLPR